MQLLLLRHADAETAASSDAARALSEKGREQARRVGRFCASRSICPELILASPLLRAAQTAQIVADEVLGSGGELISAPFLTAGMTPAAALEELKAYTKFKSVMIVGHEPDFSHLAAALLGVPTAGALHVRKATLVSLEFNSPSAFGFGKARLDFLIPAKLM